MATFSWLAGEEVVIDEFDETASPQRIADDSEQLPTPGDCYFGFHAIALIAEYLSNRDYTIDEEEIPVDLEPAFQFLNATRRLLREMHVSLSQKLSEEVNERDLRRIVSFISDCRIAVEDHENSANLREEYSDLFNINLPIRDTLHELLDYLDTLPQKPKQPYDLYERLSASVSFTAKARRKMIRRLSYASKYQPNSDRQELACQIVLLDADYSTYISNMKDQVVRYCERAGRDFFATMSIGSSDFTNAIGALRRGINQGGRGNKSTGGGSGTSGGTNGNNNPLDPYCGDNPRCYGLLLNGTDKLISLSGLWDATDPRIAQQFLNLSANTIQKWKSVKSCLDAIILADPLLNGCNYAELNDQVVTNIPTQETLDDVIRKNQRSRRGEFSCCERKMISKTSPQVQPCFLFTRFMPCTNCEISIRDFHYKTNMNLRVYYLKTDSLKGFTIKRYMIK